MPRILPKGGDGISAVVDSNRDNVRTNVGHSEPKPLEFPTALDGNLRAPSKELNQSQNVGAITASFARQGFLSTNTTSNPMAGVSSERAGHTATVDDEPRRFAPHNATFARMRGNLDVGRGPVGKQASKESGGGSSDNSQSETSVGCSARSSGSSRATEDAFSRFQARLNGQGSSLPDPKAMFTESTRKKLSVVNDRTIGSSDAQTAYSGAKSASASADIASPSTSHETLDPNLSVIPQAVKTELSTRNLNVDRPRQQAETSVQQQSIGTELSGPNDFNTQYRSKYKNIRSIFDTLHSSAKASPNENQLFRRLGEAYIMEDTDEFESVYTELLLLVGELTSGIAVSG